MLVEALQDHHILRPPKLTCQTAMSSIPKVKARPHRIQHAVLTPPAPNIPCINPLSLKFHVSNVISARKPSPRKRAGQIILASQE